MKNLFSDTYFEARTRFVDATKVLSYRSSYSGPEDQPLSTEVAYLGDPDADSLLVSIAGTHGVEGYCGSAAQLSLLQSELADSLGGSVGILLIHALNAHGFAWDRRVTAEGCDLNRNFVDFTKPLPENPGYDELADHLVPSDLSAESLAVAERAIAESGRPVARLRFRRRGRRDNIPDPKACFSEARALQSRGKFLKRSAWITGLPSDKTLSSLIITPDLAPMVMASFKPKPPRVLKVIIVPSRSLDHR